MENFSKSGTEGAVSAWWRELCEPVLTAHKSPPQRCKPRACHHAALEVRRGAYWAVFWQGSKKNLSFSAPGHHPHPLAHGLFLQLRSQQQWPSPPHLAHPLLAPSSTFSVLVALVFELRTSCFPGRCSDCLGHSASPVLWRVFRERVSQTSGLGLALNHDPPELCLLCS
jgi:hypothetical protein